MAVFEHMKSICPHSWFQPPLEAAQAAKAKGNKFFKVGKYDSAINCYTEAISLCPPQHTAEISTFYQNRAAAYEQLVRLPQCFMCSKFLKILNF